MSWKRIEHSSSQFLHLNGWMNLYIQGNNKQRGHWVTGVTSNSPVELDSPPYTIWVNSKKVGTTQTMESAKAMAQQEAEKMLRAALDELNIVKQEMA
jgi:hypothetical protein